MHIYIICYIYKIYLLAISYVYIFICLYIFIYWVLI